MKELSLNILDIAENSVKAGAGLIEIIIDESDRELTITIRDNGCGMSRETARAAQNPFYTTRTTRRVGMGIPLFKMEAEQTGGSFELTSRSRQEFPENPGTTVKASFYKDHLDFTPLGDVTATLITLIQGHPEIDFRFEHRLSGGSAVLDTRQLRQVLGEEVSLGSFEVLGWIRDYLQEQYSEIKTGKEEPK